MWICNEGGCCLLRELRSELNSEEACQGVTDSVRRGNFIHLLELGQKNPSEFWSGDLRLSLGAFSDTWSPGGPGEKEGAWTKNTPRPKCHVHDKERESSSWLEFRGSCFLNCFGQKKHDYSCISRRRNYQTLIQSVSCSPLDNSELPMTQQKNAFKRTYFMAAGWMKGGIPFM